MNSLWIESVVRFLKCGRVGGLLGVGLIAVWVMLPAGPTFAQSSGVEREAAWERLRLLFVPSAELPSVLAGDTPRVVMDRQQVEELLQKLRWLNQNSGEAAGADFRLLGPQQFIWQQAHYELDLDGEIGRLRGSATGEAVGQGLFSLPLPWKQGLLRKLNQNQQPPLWQRTEDGELALLLTQAGLYTFDVEITLPVATDLVRQVVPLQLPPMPITTLDVRIPGNVDLVSGASVLARTYDAAQDVTTFSLAAVAGAAELVLTLNNRQSQQTLVWDSRSLISAQISPGLDRFQIEITNRIRQGQLSQAVWQIPADLEVSQLVGEGVRQWQVQVAEQGSTLQVWFHPGQAERPFQIAAFRQRQAGSLGNWEAPQINAVGAVRQPRIVQVATTEDLLVPDIERFNMDLVPADLAAALAPAAGDLGDTALVSHGTWYGTDIDSRLQLTLEAAQDRFTAVTSHYMLISQMGIESRSVFQVENQGELRFAVQLKVAPGFQVSSVSDAQGALPFQTVQTADGVTATVTLRRGIGGVTRNLAADAGGTDTATSGIVELVLVAQWVPQQWFADWRDRSLRLTPATIDGAQLTSGVIAIGLGPALGLRTVDPGSMVGLGRDQVREANLDALDPKLAFDFNGTPGGLSLEVERLQAEQVARSVAYYQLEPTRTLVRGEILIDVRGAAQDVFQIQLPSDAPDSVVFRCRPPQVIRQQRAVVDRAGLWEVQLSQPVEGRCHVWLDYDLPSSLEEKRTVRLEALRLVGAAWQESLVSLESGTRMEVSPTTDAPKWSVDRLPETIYQPGRRLVGVWDVTGLADSAVAANLELQQIDALPSAVVQSRELISQVSRDGTVITGARYQIKSTAGTLWLELPPTAELWSLTQDGVPQTVQFAGDNLIVALPNRSGDRAQEVQLIYRQSGGFNLETQEVSLTAPTWRLPGGEGAAAEVPVLKTRWNLTPPMGLTLRWSPQDWSVRDTRPTPTWLERNWQWLQGQVGLTRRWTRRSVETAAKSQAEYEVSEWDIAPGRETEEARQQPNAAERAEVLRSMQRRMADRDEFRVGGGLAPGAASGGEPSAQAPDFSMMAEGAGGMGYSEIPPGGALDGSTLANQQAAGQGQAGMGQAGQGQAVVANGLLPAANLPQQKPGLGLQGHRSLNIATEPMGDELEFVGLGDKPQLQVALIDKSWTDQWTWAVGCFALAIGLLCSWCSIRMGLVWAALLLLLSGGAQWLHDSLPEAATVLERLFWVVVALTLWRSLVAIGRGYRRLLTGMRRQSTPAWQSTVAGVVSVGIGLVGLSWIDHSNSACWGQGQETNAVKPLSLPDQAIVITYDPAAVQRRLDGRWLVPKAWFDRVRLAAETEASNRPVYPQELLLPGGTFDLTLPGPATLSVVGTFAVNLPGEEPTYVPLPVGSGSLLSATLDDVPVPVVDRVLKPGDGVVAAEPIKWLRLPGQGLHTLKLQWRYPVTRVPGGWEVEGQLPVSTAADIAIRELPIGSRLTWSAAQIDRSQTIDSSGAVTDLGVGPDGRFKVRWRTAEDQVRIHSAAIDHDSIVTVRESGVQVVSQFRVTTIESTRELMIRIPRGVQIERLSGDNLRGWSWVEGRADQIELQFLSSQTTHNFLLLLVGETTFWSPVPAEFDVPFPQVQGDGPVNGQVMVLRSQSLQVSTTKVQGLKRRDASADARPATWLAWYRELFPSRPYQAYQWQASAGQLQLSVARPNGQLKVGHRSVVHFDVAKTMFETQIVLEPVNGPVNRVRLQLPKSMEPLSLSCVTGSGANVAAVAYQVAKRPGGEAWDEYELRFAAYHAQPLRLTILGTLASALQQPLVWQPIQVADATQQDYEYALTRNDTVELNLTDVAGADRVLPDEFKGWLEPERVARLPLALRARTAQHSLTVSCQRSTPLVTFESITDLTVGDRLVEETVLLEWTIERSGVNQVEFLLPSRWRDCQLEGPWIGRIQREGAAEDQIRFTIHLQDRIVGQYRLVATLDLPIEATPSQASIPQNLTGETRQRWITAQNSGQTEVEFLPQRDVAQVVRQRAIFADLQRKIKAAFLTNAFSVEAQARQPVLAWRPVPRSVVETRSARIRLTETDLMLDRQGWYVARQKLQISNRTQPKLQLQMPPDARLVGLLVDGQPVQPLANPWGVASTVLIPLLKSSELNLDYPIELVYEGQIPLARGWQETAMPLATTVDIESEVSHVRLHLPPEMRPWYFGGTMSQVNSAGELLAEVQDYQTRLLADFKSSISASKLSLKQQMRRKLEFDDYLSRNSMFDEAAQSSQLRSEIEELSKVLSGDELTDQPTLGNRANIRGLVADQENRNEVKQDATYFNNFDNPVADQQQEIMLGQIQQRQSQQTDKSNAGDLRLNANQLLSQNYAADEDLQVLSGKSRRSDVAALLPPQGQAEKPGRFAEATPQLPDFGLADAAPQQIAGPTVPRIPSGLSLDFAPAGTVYYFRVPRGKPELTVTWSTHEAATRLGSTVQLVGFAALLLFMARLFRGSGQRRSQSVG